VCEQPCLRQPQPFYGNAKISPYEMIRFSIAIPRECFGGYAFCAITEHERRIIVSCSAARDTRRRPQSALGRGRLRHRTAIPQPFEPLAGTASLRLRQCKVRGRGGALDPSAET
jgi:hypothetical protein